ncbi:NAD(P)/FAD-dependent oxidoreductase [Candidatus Protochlamydia sp. W-9]|uniref:NAD(P)/FAD-dependent oxidoreductase n=1 Tax=Candidatus Protochlamydia sp. W-9 TaxID=1785087 RepID=UPI00096AC44A|nr:NAD(P)/FAD-dependent oxidoreductase [Candidatus Protochlamydia sp. W-9]
MRKIIVVGGGFGGLNTVRSLKNAQVEILLIDRTNHHVFQPLLYQVATAALSVENITTPLREILKNQSNVRVLMAEIEKINLENQYIQAVDGQQFYYDDLILAPGARHTYFGHDNWEHFAPGLKTVADAFRIREKMLMAFEKAERCENREAVQSSLSFVIIGAGPTGVEMAGSMAEFAHRTLFKNFRSINPTNSKIYLIEEGQQILPSFPRELANRALEDLKQLGVEVLLNTFVTQVTNQGVYMNEKFLPAFTVVWAAGNEASPLVKNLGVPLDKQSRVKVQPDLTIPGFTNVFVIGDAAAVVSSKNEFLPGIAPVAIQQGHYVANLIKKNILPSNRKPFLYWDKGMIATIGRGRAVAILGNFKFSGFLAWLIWCFIHILYLVSFGHRLLVMIQWIFLYLFNRRQARVIIRPIQE